MGLFGRKKEKESEPKPEYILMADGKVCQPTAPPTGFSVTPDAQQAPDGLLFGSAGPFLDVEQTASDGMLFAVQQPYVDAPSEDMLFGATQEQPLFFAQEQSEPNLFAPQQNLPLDEPKGDLTGADSGMENFFAAGDAAEETADFSGFFDLDASDTSDAAPQIADTDFGSFFRLGDMDASAEETSTEQPANSFFAVGTEPIAEAPAEPEPNAGPVEAEPNPFAGFFDDAEPIAEAPSEPEPNTEPVEAEPNPFAGFFDAEPIAEAPSEPEPNAEPVEAEPNPFAGFFDAEPIAEAPAEPEQSAEPIEAEPNPFAGFFDAEPIAEAPSEPEQNAEPIEAEPNPFVGFFDAEPIAEAPSEPEQSAEPVETAEDVPLETADSDVDDIFASFFGES